MDLDLHIRTLIAHYLKDKNLDSTLAAFELETGKKYSTDASLHDESLQSIIQDRNNFNDNITNFPKASNLDDVNTVDSFSQSDIILSKKIKLPNWSIRYPDNNECLNIGSLNSLVITSTFFHARVNSVDYNLAFFVTNTKFIIIYDIDLNIILVSLSDPFNGQPVKIIQGIDGTDSIIISDMNGNVSIMQLIKIYRENSNDDIDWNLVKISNDNDQQIKLHRRLITDFKFVKYHDDKYPNLLGYFSSIGWDGKVTIGSVTTDGYKIGLQVLGDYKLFSNPTSLLLYIDKSTNLPLIIVGRLESTLLTCFTLSSIEDPKITEIGKISLNDSEFSSHSFQPMCLTKISDVGNDSIITIATDHIPYMRLITIVVPSIKEILSYTNKQIDDSIVDSDSIKDKLLKLSKLTKVSDTSFHSKSPILRKYILSNFNSLSPQDKYSNAIILSRPNCGGLWIPGDDGKLRGFDLRTGTVVETLNSNDGRAKSAFIGYSKTSEEVVVVCGAVDRKIMIWRYKQ